MRVITIILISLLSVKAIAQQVKILERGSNFPIENVTIYNDSNDSYVHTNKNGIADLSAFKNSDILFTLYILLWICSKNRNSSKGKAFKW